MIFTKLGMCRASGLPRAALALVLLPAGAAPPPLRLESTWGLDTLNSAVAAPQNVALPIDDYRLEGFERDLFTEYRAASVRRTGPNARISATVNVSGEFYPAFIFYDSGGKEAVALVVDGVERGRAVADWDNNNQRLFFLPERVSFKPGSVVELRALNTDGIYRTETLLLLKDRPAPRKREYVIRQVEARAEGLSSARVTWITSWPAACTVEWTTGDSGGKVTEEAAFNNHRVVLTGLNLTAAHRYRIVAATPEGEPVVSAWQSIETKPRTAAAGKAGKGAVLLTVGDLLGSGRKDALPVTSGVPFPRGVLRTAEDLRLLDGSGREVALQTRALGWWDDGSVKWALLDFPGVNGAVYKLEYGAGTRRKPAVPALKVVESKEAIEVVTGPLKLQVSKVRYGFPGVLWLDGNRDGHFDDAELVVSSKNPGLFQLTGAGGKTFSSLAPPDEVVVEENGPLRATVRISGGHHGPEGQRLFAYTIRLHAYAGRPFLRIQHTLENDNGAEEFTTIGSLSLRLPLVRPPERAGQGTSEEFVIKQYRDHPRAEGTVRWSDGVRAVTLAIRDFWQNYPKTLAVTPTGFDLGICPPLAKDEYADAKGTVDEHRLYYYLQNGGYKLRQGVSKTHEFWLGAGGARQDQAYETPPLSPLRAAAPPEWYASSKVFGELARRAGTGVLAQYDKGFERSFEAYLANREKNREYGMLNFGDWWGEREINWGNSEYDTQHAFFLQFARTGDWRYFRAGEEMEWHNRDVDTVHHHTNKSRIGGVYAHAVGHTGDYYTESPVPGKGIVRGGMIVSHTFIEGHLGYYFLTGDTRSLETARRIADRFDSYETRNYDFTNCRNPGWHLILTMAMYDASNDPYYLNAARIIVERVFERQTPDGGWKRQLVPEHCDCLPRHHGNAGFMVGILLTGLKYYYNATGDERAANSIIRGAHFLIDDMWMPEVDGFRYTSCPRTGKGAWSNFLLFDGIAFAHRRTGDQKLGEVLKRGTGSALQGMTGWGKGFTQYTRVAPSFIGYLADLQQK